MAKDALIDSHVSERQCKQAIEALLSHELKVQIEKEENELLPGRSQHIWLMVAVKKIYPERKIKPLKIPIVHPLVDPRTTAICLITKDPQREYKDLLEAHGIKFISRVVGIAKLKGKFKPYEARRLLLRENGMFLADDRVIPLLPGLLGKKWFEAKKQPVPVSLTRKDLKGELERAISSTYMHQNQGTCTAVKIGTILQTPTQILANLKSALPAIVQNIKGQWENLQSLQIKTNSSVSLPIWTCRLDDSVEGRWGGSAAAKKVAKRSDDLAEDEDPEVASSREDTPKPPIDKKRKRALDDVDFIAVAYGSPDLVSSKKSLQKATVRRPETFSSMTTSDSTSSAGELPIVKPTRGPSGGVEKAITKNSSLRSRTINKKVKASTALSKKKEKVVKWVGGKLAKGHLLGKKVARLY